MGEAKSPKVLGLRTSHKKRQLAEGCQRRVKGKGTNKAAEAGRKRADPWSWGESILVSDKATEVRQAFSGA